MTKQLSKLDHDTRATIGCLQLPTDLTLDREGPALMARVPGVRLRLQKIRLDGDGVDVDTYLSGKGRISLAADAIRPVGSLDVLALACTSLAFTLGQEEVQAEMKSIHPDAKITDMAASILAALEWFGAKRISLLTPYLDELHERNLRLLSDAGYEVLSHRNLGLGTDEEIGAIAPESIIEQALATDVPDADVFVLGCSAFRACSPGFLDALEERLGKPVVASQQAFLWNVLRLAGIEDKVGGYGKLLAGRRAIVPESFHSRVSAAKPAEEDRFKDLYPTRVSSPGSIPRVDQIVDRTGAFPGPLSPAQVDQFERNGFMVLRQVFEPAEVETIRNALYDLRREYESQTYEELDRGTDMHVITEKGGRLISDDGSAPVVLKSIWQIHCHPDDAPHMKNAASLSWRTVRDSRVIDPIRQLLGEEVYIHQSRINFQRGWGPGSRGGSGFLWHQDWEQWHADDGMPRMRAISMAILTEKAQPANGALMIMPGSHVDLIQASPGSGDAYATGALSSGPELPAEILAENADRYGIVYCAGEPGDVVLFDCNVIHGSHTNISPWGRMIMFAVYNAVSNTLAPKAYGAEYGAGMRPEHFGSRDPKMAGVPLPSLKQALTSV